jgi:hypothetical protein
MLSHRYGSRFLLEEIPKNEFELIAGEFNEMDFSSYNVKNAEMIELLARCYELDDNDLVMKYYKIRSFNDIRQGLDVFL